MDLQDKGNGGKNLKNGQNFRADVKDGLGDSRALLVICLGRSGMFMNSERTESNTVVNGGLPLESRQLLYGEPFGLQHRDQIRLVPRGQETGFRHNSSNEQRSRPPVNRILRSCVRISETGSTETLRFRRFHRPSRYLSGKIRVATTREMQW